METLTRQEEKVKNIVERSYFPVEKIQTGEKSYSIINRETNQKLSDVSKRYTLVKNQEIFEPFMKQFGYNNVHRFFGYGGGKYYYMEIKTGRKFDFGTPEKPDTIDEILSITNSYNKTKSFQFRLGAFRWICSNGLYSGTALINYKKIHVGEIPLQKLIFNTLLKYQDNTFENWKTLKNVPLTLDRKLELIDRFEPFNELDKEGNRIESNYRLNREIKRSSEYYTRNIKNELDNQPNAWGLYNQFNRAISAKIGGKSQVERRINTNNKMEEYLLKNIG